MTQPKPDPGRVTGDVAGIARSLTKARRAGVLSGRWDDDSSLRAGQRAMFYDLTEQGLFALDRSLRDGGFTLTLLGLAVRAHLLQEHPDA